MRHLHLPMSLVQERVEFSVFLHLGKLSAGFPRLSSQSLDRVTLFYIFLCFDWNDKLMLVQQALCAFYSLSHLSAVPWCFECFREKGFPLQTSWQRGLHQGKWPLWHSLEAPRTLCLILMLSTEKWGNGRLWSLFPISCHGVLSSVYWEWGVCKAVCTNVWVAVCCSVTVLI